MKQTAIEILTWIGIQLIKAGLLKLQKIVEKIDEKEPSTITTHVLKQHEEKSDYSYTQNEMDENKNNYKLWQNGK